MSTVVQASDHLVEPPLLKAVLALTLVAMARRAHASTPHPHLHPHPHPHPHPDQVCPAWRMYIILHTMKHSTEHMAESTYEHGS